MYRPLVLHSSNEKSESFSSSRDCQNSASLTWRSVSVLLWTVETKMKLNWEFLFCLLSGFNESRSRCCLRSHSFHFPLSPRHTLSLYLSLSKHWITGGFFLYVQPLWRHNAKQAWKQRITLGKKKKKRTLWQFAVIQRSNSCQSALSAK